MGQRERSRRFGGPLPTDWMCTPISRRISSIRSCWSGEPTTRWGTLDAIGDHNDIRDGVRDANAAMVGTGEWWAAVGRAREANDDHMAEEEREGLSDFRRHAPIGLREALGRQFSEFMAAHPTTRGLPIADRDPQTYVDNIGTESRRQPKDTSLGIGSLKGQ